MVLGFVSDLAHAYMRVLICNLPGAASAMWVTGVLLQAALSWNGDSLIMQ